jgi:hypothetical protein
MNEQRWIRLPILIMVWLLPALAHSQDLTMRAWYDITFSGTSSLHDFDGTVQSRAVTIPVDADTSGLEALMGTATEVRVQDMDTGNKRMNRNMYKMFEADKFPLITGRLTAAGEAMENERSLELSIRNVTRTIPVTVVASRQMSGRTEIDLEMTVSLAAFDLEAPTAMLGLLKVDDAVKVRATLILADDSARTAPAAR